MIARLDEAIRARIFQPIADWSTDRFDRSCYWLAGQCAVGIAATAIPLIVRMVQEGEQTPAFIMLVVAPFFSWAGCARAGRLERRFRADPLRPPPAPEAGDRFSRLFWLFFLALDLVIFDSFADLARNVVYDLAFLTHNYFIACLPRLPRPRKERVPAHLVAQGAPS